MFDLPLHKQGILPIWIRLQNLGNGYYQFNWSTPKAASARNPKVTALTRISHGVRKCCRILTPSPSVTRTHRAR